MWILNICSEIWNNAVNAANMPTEMLKDATISVPMRNSNNSKYRSSNIKFDATISCACVLCHCPIVTVNNRRFWNLIFCHIFVCVFIRLWTACSLSWNEWSLQQATRIGPLSQWKEDINSASSPNKRKPYVDYHRLAFDQSNRHQQQSCCEHTHQQHWIECKHQVTQQKDSEFSICSNTVGNSTSHFASTHNIRLAQCQLA